LAEEFTGVLSLSEQLLAAARLFGFRPDSMASRRAKEEQNCVSMCTKRDSKSATLEAVSDIRDTEVSSGLVEAIGAKETECVGVEAIVGVLQLGLLPFFFKTLLTVLLKVERESVSL
jgi:hypothetical protein